MEGYDSEGEGADQMSDSTSRCVNPLCSCDPCGCGDRCRCGVTKLSGLERRLMECIWLSPGAEMTVRDVAEALPDYAYTTVATVLDRLVAKGVLHCRKVRRTKRYRAVGSSGSHTAVLMYDALCADSDPDGALRRFAASLTDAEATVLFEALDRR